MIKFWIITVCVFLIITYFLQKAFYNYAKGNKAKEKKLWNIYHWEGLVAISSGLTFILLFVLKSTNILTF
jgi:hypothetical protein